MDPTEFQKLIQRKVNDGNSILLVAPTGLGKTFAVTGDLEENFKKTVYAVPLRALGDGIRKSITELERNDGPIEVVVHHGDRQESTLFSEEVIVTTYDQVVCGTPGLPLSLPLKAGHAVAGSLLMSRLILDEGHLAWGISDRALSILLGIIDFRKKFGLQTILLTATLPDNIAKKISERLGMDLLIVGKGEDDCYLSTDEGLIVREENRRVKISTIDIKKQRKKSSLDYTPLIKLLTKKSGKRIYFANTVERIQKVYDLLVNQVDQTKVIVLHNRMPKKMRSKAEEEALKFFSKNGDDGNVILLTNQVAEAGLDISAPFVISDPAPVDTLIQRAGRCARWFRQGPTEGEFIVLKPPRNTIEGSNRDAEINMALPYQSIFVIETVYKNFVQPEYLTWDVEREWMSKAWGGGEENATKSLNRSLDQITFALNLFDRAAQERSPGKIADAFRKILSVEVAVEKGDRIYLDDLANRNLQTLLGEGKRPETSSISLGKAWSLVRDSRGGAAVIRYEDGELQIQPADSVRLGDVLVVPSTMAYLHPVKGLCFGNGNDVEGAILSSKWFEKEQFKRAKIQFPSRQQTLFEHSRNVMEKTYERLITPGKYHETLIKILGFLEPEKDPEKLANTIAQLAAVGAAFHDVGKADRHWQEKARSMDEYTSDKLIGRTKNSGERIGVPHTPPSFTATIKTCEILLGSVESAEHLIRTISLASSRHHSSLLNPALVDYNFQPHENIKEFIEKVFEELNVPETVLNQTDEIAEASKKKPAPEQVPLMLPNEDLFPLYALIGRAILLSDREDAADQELEKWRETS